MDDTTKASQRTVFGSSASKIPSEGTIRALQFGENVSETPPNLPARKMSMRSVVSTSSSSPERTTKAMAKPADDRGTFRVIGRGTVGTVFEMPGTEIAVKKGRDQQALYNDYYLTSHVFTSFQKAKHRLQDLYPSLVIPKSPACLRYKTQESKDYWSTNLSRFPSAHKDPGAAFEMDKILPIPQVYRELLINTYFDEASEIREEAKNDEGNQHCLIRIYLGERETEEQMQCAYDSLENFPMRLNMVEHFMAEDKSVFAGEMALALSIIHWQAQIDGMDCEYVVGGSISPPEKRRLELNHSNPIIPQFHDHEIGTFNHRPLHLWVLDFDKASPFQLTEEDVDRRLIPGFVGNDPYYPRPNVDKDLWDHFCSVYLKASKAILTSRDKGEKILALPQRFLRKVELRIEEHEKWDREHEIVFRE
ncbi:hypothetical protein ACLMJK_006415 [Lecanora helva]